MSAARTAPIWTLEFARFADAIHYRNAEYGNDDSDTGAGAADDVNPNRVEVQTSDEGHYSVPSPLNPCATCGHVMTKKMTRAQAAAAIDRARLMVAHAQGKRGEDLVMPQVWLCKDGEVVA